MVARICYTLYTHIYNKHYIYTYIHTRFPENMRVLWKTILDNFILNFLNAAEVRFIFDIYRCRT